MSGTRGTCPAVKDCLHSFLILRDREKRVTSRDIESMPLLGQEEEIYLSDGELDYDFLNHCHTENSTISAWTEFKKIIYICYEAGSNFFPHRLCSAKFYSGKRICFHRRTHLNHMSEKHLVVL